MRLFDANVEAICRAWPWLNSIDKVAGPRPIKQIVHAFDGAVLCQPDDARPTNRLGTQCRAGGSHTTIY